MEFLNKTDILIFYANAIDSMDDSGSSIKGCSVHYMFWDNMQYGQSEPDVTKPVGMQRGKSWVDYSIREKIRIAPALYEGSFSMTVGSDGKVVLKLVDVAYKCNVEIKPYLLKGLVVPGMLENVAVENTAPADETAAETAPADETAAETASAERGTKKR